ncbi:hypothetical protein [Streptomyces sp. NBC_01443]|uniref:hypothetical protein n=1 Tax=Streptomyces sp. NBC_01443 TaxID=2903868 RepID=UPI0022595FC8|nr:hypothetical protein [Streptomyces sp. NBC_01443]MCX4628151.1 hypothetical protein [Streptomyces sp. NBC_01443]
MGTNNDDHTPAVSDEEWARFMEQAQAGTGQAPREPSARARMVTARLQGEPAEPPGWRTGPAWQERERQGRGKRRLKAAGAIVFIAALALIAIRPELVIDRVTGKAAQNGKAAEPLPAETARPSAPPSAPYPDRPTLKEPFKGSPALQWADGAAGIEVPVAEAVGGMSKEQVADALEKAKQFLVAANLDPATLRGERPAAALALLDPKLEEQLGRLEGSLTAPTKENDPLHLFSRVKPAELKPAGDVVKVRGRMWVEPGKEAGQANVLADYTFVYPFVKAKPGAEQVERTVVRREITFSIADPRKWQATAGKIWLEKFNVDLANSACDVYDGFLHPAFDEDTPTGPAPSGTPVDPYDRSKSMETGGQEGCGTVSRT